MQYSIFADHRISGVIAVLSCVVLQRIDAVRAAQNARGGGVPTIVKAFIDASNAHSANDEVLILILPYRLYFLLLYRICVVFPHFSLREMCIEILQSIPMYSFFAISAACGEARGPHHGDSVRF